MKYIAIVLFIFLGTSDYANNHQKPNYKVVIARHDAMITQPYKELYEYDYAMNNLLYIKAEIYDDKETVIYYKQFFDKDTSNFFVPKRKLSFSGCHSFEMIDDRDTSIIIVSLDGRYSIYGEYGIYKLDSLAFQRLKFSVRNIFW